MYLFAGPADGGEAWVTRDLFGRRPAVNKFYVVKAETPKGGDRRFRSPVRCRAVVMNKDEYLRGHNWMILDVDSEARRNRREGGLERPGAEKEDKAHAAQ